MTSSIATLRLQRDCDPRFPRGERDGQHVAIHANEDRFKPKYNLRYYADLARNLEEAGARLLAIKDKAGVCRPRACRPGDRVEAKDLLLELA